MSDADKKEYIEEESFLAKLNMVCSGLFALIVVTVLIKICRGSKHPFFIRIIILELVGLVLIELREGSFLIAVNQSKGFEEGNDEMFVQISTLFHAFLSSIASLLFLIVRWVFCLKYLIIAREMPGLFKGEVANFESTGRYKCYRLIVTVLFCVVTLWNTLNTYRWLMEVYEGHPEKNR